MSPNTRILRFAALFLFTATALGLAAMKSGPDEGSTVLVSTAWVAERLDSEDLVLLHVGNEYEREHLPGARYVELSMISRSEGDLNLQMLPPEELKAAFEKLGISDDSRIVIYIGNDWVTAAARTYVTLSYLGLASQTSLMDGGMLAWKAEGRPVTDEVPSVAPGVLTPKPQTLLIATADWLGENLDNQDVVIIDARTPGYYSGWKGGHGQPRAGHVAGAHNVPFTSVVDDETMKMKDIDELRAMFEAAGARPGDKVVTYCHIGQQASLVFVAARYLGYEAALYDGSFQEYSSLETLPVERPAAAWMPKLISTEELASLISGGGVSILDLRSHLGEYLEGHIPGASYVHYETLRATKAGVPADLLPEESYTALFSQLGIRLDRPVVVYGDGGAQNFNATFLTYILAGYGHPAIRLLDGGYAKWTAEDRAIGRDYPEIEASTFSTDGFDPNLASRGWVSWTVEHAGTPDAEGMLLVDVRPTAQYEGRAGAQARLGHIPGAVNHVWSSDLVTDGDAKVWKSIDELRASYTTQGITADKHVILYCNTGTEATHAYFALKILLDYPNVEVYFPSYTDWAGREELPVEKLAAATR